MSADPFDLREALIPADVAEIERLWLEYLTWGNDEMEARHGFRLPVREAVDHDLESIEQFQPPGGHILLACAGEHAFGIGCLRRIQPDTAEIKRNVRGAVAPARRGRQSDPRRIDSGRRARGLRAHPA